MLKVYNNVLELIGSTPILKLNNLCAHYDIEGCNIYGKLEYLNPGGSIKDRVAYNMIIEALERGDITKGATLIEPTSGNTGIGIAMVAAVMGFKAVITLPETMSAERRALLGAYGAQLVLTDATKGMAGAIAKAKEIHENTPNSMVLGQFDNPDNPSSHYKTTGPEIWQQLEGKIDVLVAGVGTGGTITGIGRYLKEKNPDIKIIAVEPYNSAVLSGEKPGAHNLQGIGGGFIPEILDQNIYDEIIKIKDEEAYEAGKLLATSEGILCGITSGAACYAAIDVAKRSEYVGKNILVILPDSGDRYLSTPLFAQ